MKKLRIEVIAEMEVDPTWYRDDGSEATDAEIIEAETENWQEWIVDNVISEEVSIVDDDE